MKETHRRTDSSRGGTRASLATEFADGLLGKVCPFFGFLQLLLCLAELSQVEGGDFFGFLDLPLVGLDLLLQFVDQVLHTLVVFAVLFGLEGELLDAPLRLTQVLLCVSVSPLFTVKLVLELPDPLFEFLDGLLASLKGVGFSFIQPDLQFLDLLFKGLAEFLLGLSVVLFSAQLVGKTGSVNHGLLGLLLRVLSLVEELVEVGVQGLQLGLEFPLGSGQGGALGGQLVELFVSVAEFLLGLAAGTVGLLQEGAGLFQFVLEGVGTALRDAELFAGIVAGTLFLFQSGLEVLDLGLVALDVLLGLSVSLVGVVKSDFELVDVSLKLLLHAQGLSLALSLGFEGSLHGVEGTLVVLAGVFEFLFLLLDASVDLLPDLGKLELSAENLVLLLFEGSLSLLKSSLELVLLSLKALPGLLDLVDVAATFTDLVKKILDFVGEVLVLAADSLELFLAFFVGTLETEQFGGVVAALLLAGIELGGKVVDLELPFSDDLVEGLLLLLGSVGNSGGTVDLELQVLDLGGEALLGLLESNNLLVEGLNGLLGFGEAGLELALGLLEFLGAGNTLGLVLGAPELSLGVGLGKLALKISLAFGFLLDLFADVVQVVLEVAELAKKGGAFLWVKYITLYRVQKGVKYIKIHFMYEYIPWPPRRRASWCPRVEW